MKKRILRTIALGCALVGALIGTGTTADAAVTLATQGVGYVRPTLLGSAFTITELANMIKVYNGTSTSPIAGENYTVVHGSGTPSGPLSVPTTLAPNPAGGTLGNGLPTATLDLGTGGYQYLVAQWDGPNGANAIYYIGGLTGTITIVNDLGNYIPQSEWEHGTTNPSTYGLSHTFLIPVPEPSTYFAGALLLVPVLMQVRRWKRAA